MFHKLSLMLHKSWSYICSHQHGISPFSKTSSKNSKYLRKGYRENPDFFLIELPIALPIELPIELPIGLPIELPIELLIKLLIKLPIELRIELPIELPIETWLGAKRAETKLVSAWPLAPIHPNPTSRAGGKDDVSLEQTPSNQ